VSVTPVGPSGLPGWPVELLLSDHDEFLVGPDHDSPERARRLVPPCGVTGPVRAEIAARPFLGRGQKGQRFLIAAQTVELRSPADVYLTVRDTKVRAGPHRPAARPAIDFTARRRDFFVVADT